MSTFVETDHPRDHPTGRTRFSEKANSAPDGILDSDAPTGTRSQAPGESLVWAVEGDDHEVELVEAASSEEALELAGDAFRSRYDDEGYSDDLLTVAGAFRGDIDETDELEFVPTDGTTEGEARRTLGMYL